jgi:hypothetical protein
LLEAFNNFLNPFALPDHSTGLLFFLASGKAATKHVEEDLLKYISAGKEAAERFIEERLRATEVTLHDTLKKLNLKTFQSLCVEKKATSSRQKAVRIKAERNLLGQLLIMKQTYDISFDKLFESPLYPVPWALVTADGSLYKTNKAQLLHHMEGFASPADGEDLQTKVTVVDGNALLQSLVRLPATFGELARTVFSCLPNVKTVHFVTDSYHTDSIKQAERVRRGSSATYLIDGPATLLPNDFSKFMLNSDKKSSLYLSFLQNGKAIITRLS